jgi:hypothetical protein
MWKLANFHLDYALYRLNMVGVVMAHLKYLSLDDFLRYFDHSNRIPCLSMESFSKNHVETGNFPYGFCIKMVSYWFHMVCVLMARLKYLSLDVFLRYFDHSNRIPCVSMDPYSTNPMWKQANFHMDYALYRLEMVVKEMARLRYLSLDFFLQYFDHSN